ncbi:hypothetical protein [Hoylesella pleuritidis]|uniref:hypothetical protein n=1 Tax=Hoylesella pleuritidis TaxID=407975 RepID=UPI0023570296|nr:hypothetical protein [Hoylesella pleuritidis]
MEITELEYQQIQTKIAEQQREIDTLKGKDADEQVREYLQQRRQQAANTAKRCEELKNSFK